MEFIFVMLLFVFMLNVTYNAVLAFSVYQYLSYATFMAARAYQSSDGSAAEQLDNATNALRNYIPGLPGAGAVNHPLVFADVGAVSTGSLGDIPGRRTLAMINRVSVTPQAIPTPGGEHGVGPGVRISFRVPFVFAPLGLKNVQDLVSLDFETHAFLGREPSVADCQLRLRELIQGAGATNPGYSVFMDDSGC